MTTREGAVSSTEARIGEVLKQLREREGLSLRALATRAGFSPSFLSQLENGQVSPSIASLDRIAAQLGVTLASLFEASHAPVAAVVRADERPGYTSTWSRARIESLTAIGGRGTLEAVVVTLAPGGASGKHPSSHPRHQFAYVLQGSVTLFLGDDRMPLGTGDAVVIAHDRPRRWENDSTETTQVLLVSSRLSE